jgi:hypothetical protein
MTRKIAKILTLALVAFSAGLMHSSAPGLAFPVRPAAQALLAAEVTSGAAPLNVYWRRYRGYHGHPGYHGQNGNPRYYTKSLRC